MILQLKQLSCGYLPRDSPISCGYTYKSGYSGGLGELRILQACLLGKFARVAVL